MGSLDSLHVQEAMALAFKDSGVTRVSKGTRVSVTHACQIVLVTAESLSYGLCLERAMAVVYHPPYNVVLYHI